MAFNRDFNPAVFLMYGVTMILTVTTMTILVPILPK
jgi:hypothetical protein